MSFIILYQPVDHPRAQGWHSLRIIWWLQNISYSSLSSLLVLLTPNPSEQVAEPAPRLWEALGFPFRTPTQQEVVTSVPKGAH